MDNSNKRGAWASNFGFILSTVGSAVGLGNIWGFPYKMGKSGGFSFLLLYILMAFVVGFVMILTELAMGRKTGKGIIGAYNELSKKFKGYYATHKKLESTGKEIKKLEDKLESLQI